MGMVQVLKDSVRNKISKAAEIRFSEVGYKQTTIGAIAQEAGIATGTVYKYFPNKETLFQSIITSDFVEEFSCLTRNRIASFAQPGGMDGGRIATEGEVGKLLQFITRNRLKVIILLAWGEGTQYEHFASSYIQSMETQTLTQARAQFPQLDLTPTFRFMVHTILVDSINGIVAILRKFDEEEPIHEAFAAFEKYQLAGINALTEWACSSRSDYERI
jgi:AcrR family transcriptional regulator